jgi:hypothetical protein
MPGYREFAAKLVASLGFISAYNPRHDIQWKQANAYVPRVMQDDRINWSKAEPRRERNDRMLGACPDLCLLIHGHDYCTLRTPVETALPVGMCEMGAHCAGCTRFNQAIKRISGL